MSSLSGHSRRALIAATAALAAAPAAEAKKKKRKKKKTLPPLASAMSRIDNIGFSNTDPSLFQFGVSGIYRHAATGDAFGFGLTIALPLAELGSAARARLVAEMQTRFANLLQSSGHDVPPDRVEVILL